MFTTGSEWFAASANTGGTAGVPLKLVRSLDGIVFEQACIDRLIQGLGISPRGVRTATCARRQRAGSSRRCIRPMA